MVEFIADVEREVDSFLTCGVAACWLLCRGRDRAVGEVWEFREVSLFLTGRGSISLTPLTLEKGSSWLPPGSLVMSADMGDGSSVSEERSMVTESKNVFALNWAASTSADFQDDLISLADWVGFAPGDFLSLFPSLLLRFQSLLAGADVGDAFLSLPENSDSSSAWAFGVFFLWRACLSVVFSFSSPNAWYRRLRLSSFSRECWMKWS